MEGKQVLLLVILALNHLAEGKIFLRKGAVGKSFFPPCKYIMMINYK